MTERPRGEANLDFSFRNRIFWWTIQLFRTNKLSSIPAIRKLVGYGFLRRYSYFGSIENILLIA